MEAIHPVQYIHNPELGEGLRYWLMDHDGCSLCEVGAQHAELRLCAARFSRVLIPFGHATRGSQVHEVLPQP